MKKTILTIVFLLTLIVITKAQKVNDTPLNEVDVDYIQIVGTSKLLSTKVTISIDFGQDKTLFSQAKDTQLYDNDGNKMTFESMIDALNFLSNNGYEFVNAYVITVSNQNVYHYVLKKKK